MGAQYKPSFEMFLYLTRKPPQWNGSSYEPTCWQVARDSKTDHPTQKPTELAARAIRNSSKKGDVVFDLFGGSGSTLIAAHEMGRACRMMELSPAYCDVIVDRWERLTGMTAERDATES